MFDKQAVHYYYLMYHKYLLYTYLGGELKMVSTSLRCPECQHQFKAAVDQDEVACPQCQKSFDAKLAKVDEVSAPKNIVSGR